jgi:hypothetical protein
VAPGAPEGEPVDRRALLRHLDRVEAALAHVDGDAARLVDRRGGAQLVGMLER